MFKIHKKIDVFQLKADLWNYITPRIESMPDERQSSLVAPPAQAVNMSEILHEMYETKAISKENVSVNSAFICMLHLANEKCLEFRPQMDENGNKLEKDFEVFQDDN